MSSAGPSKPKSKGNKAQYKYRGGKRAGGPPRGGDGRGDFQGGPMAKYREQPLPEMLSAPGISVSTVQGKEKIAEREIIEALEEAADALYPETAAKEDNDDEGGDIEDMLKKELETLSGAKGGKSTRFRLCKRDNACVCYVVVLEPLDPVKLVNYIMEKCEKTARCGFRFVQRLTPITKAGTANKTTLTEMAVEVLPPAFKTEDDRGLKFAINAHVRNSDKLGRLEMIKIVAEEVPKLNAAHSVDLKNPDKTIMMELFRNLVGMSVVENFERYKKFNPSATAKSAAKALGIETETEEKQDGDEGSDEIVTPTTTRGENKNANRERRAAGIAAAQAAKDAKAAEAAVPAKRKAGEDLEDGQVPKVEDVEKGEVVEDENAELGDEFQEVIEGGRATKVRREE